MRSIRLFSIFSIKMLAVGDDVVEVVVGPIHQLAQEGHEALGAVGEAVFHPWRHLGIDFAAHQAVGLQAPQGGGEHLLRAVGILLLYVAETQRGAALVEGVEHRHRPLAADARQHIADGAVGKDGVGDEIVGHWVLECVIGLMDLITKNANLHKNIESYISILYLIQAKN